MPETVLGRLHVDASGDERGRRRPSEVVKTDPGEIDSLAGREPDATTPVRVLEWSASG